MNNEEFATVEAQEFPLEKDDILWGPEEVTLKRAKFEALLGYLQDVSERLVRAEDQLSFERFDARKAKKEADVFVALAAGLSEAEHGIRKWLADPENSIQELARRAGIPYATCHRIVAGRLASGQIETGQLKRLAKAVSSRSAAKPRPRSPAAERRTREAFEPVLGAALVRAFLPEGSKVLDVAAKGDFLSRVRKEKPNVVLVDARSSKLTGEALKALGQFAVNSGITIIFTGVAPGKKTEPVEKVVAITGSPEPAKGES